MNRYVFIVCCLVVLAGCTNKQLYQAGQDAQQSECVRTAGSSSEHRDCITAQRKSYEEYEKERQDVINNNVSN